MSSIGVYFAVNALCLPLLMTYRAQESLRELAKEIYEGNPELAKKGKKLEDVVERINTSSIIATLLIGAPLFLFALMDWALDDTN